jgi:PAS domain S-box-containing protein
MEQDLPNQLSELRSTLGKMEIALGSISDAIVWTDNAGRIQWCNMSFDNLIGSSHITILGKHIAELLPLSEHGTRLPDIGHPANQILSQKNNIDGYFEFTRSGEVFDLEFLGRHLTLPGAQEFAVIVIRDITQIKELEQTKLLSEALHYAANAIAITDKNGAVIWVNHSFSQLTGYNLNEIYGRSLKFLKSGKHDHAFYRNLWKTILSGDVWEGETINRKKDGSIYVEQQTIAPVRAEDGKISNFIAIKQDISDRKRAEQELSTYRNKLEQMVEDRTRELKKAQEKLISQAMEAGMAQVAAMGLHNIGNAVTPLNVLMDTLQKSELAEISHYLEKCFLDLKSHASDLDHYLDHDARGKQVFAYMGELIDSLITQNRKQADTFNRMDKALAYISEILSLQQTYASREQEVKELVDLNDLMDDAIRMQLGAMEKRRIIVKKQFDDSVPKLLIDKNRLMQVIVNFIKNSYEAIDARKNDTGEKVIAFSSFAENGCVGFRISDNGIGIDPGKIEKIFELGQSRKGSTGFGLHYCKMCVEANGGKVAFTSPGPGKGVTVSVTFEPEEDNYDGKSADSGGR